MVLKRYYKLSDSIRGFTVVLYWMVLKLVQQAVDEMSKFYSSVILNGTETFAGVSQ